MKKVLSIVCTIVLIATMACCFAGCTNAKSNKPTTPACIEGKEHEFNTTVFRKATCLETGLEKHVCKNCEYTEHVSVDALGHQFEEMDGITMCAHCSLIESPIRDTQEDNSDVIIVE